MHQNIGNFTTDDTISSKESFLCPYRKWFDFFSILDVNKVKFFT